MKLAEAVDKVAAVFSSRGALVSNVAAVEARHAVAAAKRLKDLAAAQAEVDKLDEPRRRLRALQDEALSAANREARELAEALQPLRANPGRDLTRFRTRAERIFERVRNPKIGDRPQAEHEVNSISGAQRTTNLGAIEKWNALGGLLSRLTGEIHHELWKLDDVAQRARLAELRKELDDALEGTALASEAEA